MLAEEYQSLVESVGNIGVQEPITLFDGMVLDGWHRYRVASELGMDCPMVNLQDIDPRDFVLAKNKSRRNLTGSQRADAVTAVYAWVSPSAGRSRGAPGAPLEKTNAELAAIAGTGVRSIQQAKAVHSDAIKPVQDAVKAGTVSVKTAAAVAKLPEEMQQEIAAQGPDAMRHAAKAVPAAESEADEYTALDAANDQIEDLQAALAVANMNSQNSEEQAQAATLISELRNEVRKLSVNMRAVTQSRDSLMNELAMVKNQCVKAQALVKKLQAGVAHG